MKYIGFGLIGFHSISTIVIYFLITLKNDPEPIFSHTVKWSQVLLFNTYESIQYYSFVCTQ